MKQETECCSECNCPLHTWSDCPRNPNSSKFSEVAGKYRGSGPLYTGKLDADGTPIRIDRDRFKTKRIRLDSSGKRELVLDCIIGKVPIRGALGDSGSQGTLMSEACYRRHAAQFGPLNNVSSTRMVVEGLTGPPIGILGTIRHTVTFPDEATETNYITPHPITFLVVPGVSTDVILGLDVLSGSAGIESLNMASGTVTYGKDMTKSEYIPLSSGHRVRVRLAHSVQLNAGETQLTQLRFDAPSTLSNTTSILTSSTPMRGSDGSIFELALPTALYELGCAAGDRCFSATLTNPLSAPIMLHGGLIVGEGQVYDNDSTIRLDSITPPRPPRIAPHVSHTVPYSARRQWLNRTVEDLVSLLAAGVGDLPPPSEGTASASKKGDPMQVSSERWPVGPGPVTFSAPIPTGKGEQLNHMWNRIHAPSRPVLSATRNEVSSMQACRRYQNYPPPRLSSAAFGPSTRTQKRKAPGELTPTRATQRRSDYPIYSVRTASVIQKDADSSTLDTPIAQPDSPTMHDDDEVEHVEEPHCN